MANPKCDNTPLSHCTQLELIKNTHTIHLRTDMHMYISLGLMTLKREQGTYLLYVPLCSDTKFKGRSGMLLFLVTLAALVP